MLWIILMCICIIAAIYLAICGEDILTYFAACGAAINGQLGYFDLG